MNVKRDPDAILAAWLDEGPNRLPEPTRRAIAVSTRSIRQSRLPDWLPWRSLNMNGMGRLAIAAVAIVAVVVGGLAILRPDGSSGVGGPPSPVPSASPSASPTLSVPGSPEASVGALTQAFTSPTFGYAIKYPAGWIVTPTTDDGPTPGGADSFISSAAEDGWYLRLLSRDVPDGFVVDDWIRRNLTYADQAACMPPVDTMETLTVDGYQGRILGFCGVPPAPQIEATVVADRRVYLFTLFDGRPTPNEAETRALFDRFMTTVTLDPASAVSSPEPSPS